MKTFRVASIGRSGRPANPPADLLSVFFRPCVVHTVMIVDPDVRPASRSVWA